MWTETRSVAVFVLPHVWLNALHREQIIYYICILVQILKGNVASLYLIYSIKLLTRKIPIQNGETSEIGHRSWSILKDVVSVTVCLRIHSDHHDFRGGCAACGHDSHSRGESILNYWVKQSGYIMLTGFSLLAHEQRDCGSGWSRTIGGFGTPGK